MTLLIIRHSIHVRPFTDGDPSNMGDIHRSDTDGEIVLFCNASPIKRGRDIIIAVNGKWYKVKISDDDKILCLDDTGDGDEVPKLCGYQCLKGKEHHYYVRLRKEWRVPAMPEAPSGVSLPHR